ncbi:hypothetical protein [Pseudomonas asplenii]|uniref:hypothetical protein n=1 Tax=Pseudomonas asplenii TaxID=53407 RepID=UPI0006B41CE0|nr:hypothetical protein [Pseudomonas fuscovaginae]KPA96927.1 hypothetical protein PF70_03083 [Pseudomonas fuscovaginae]
MSIKLNVTAFASDSLAQKIINAVDAVLTSGIPQYIANRNGKTWLRVDIKSDIEDRNKQDLQFMAYNGQEVGDVIARSSWSHWSRPLEIRFAALLKAVCELVEHPATALRKRKEEENLKARRTIAKVQKERTMRVDIAARRVRLHARAKQMGATHVIRTEAGRYYFASFKKSFFGLGKTVVTVYPKDHEYGNGEYVATSPYKLTPEAAQCVTIIGVLK